MAELKPVTFKVIVNKYGQPEVIDPLTASKEVLRSAKYLLPDGTWTKGDIGGLKNAKGFSIQEAKEFVKKNKNTFIRRG